MVKAGLSKVYLGPYGIKLMGMGRILEPPRRTTEVSEMLHRIPKRRCCIIAGTVPFSRSQREIMVCSLLQPFTLPPFNEFLAYLEKYIYIYIPVW